MSCCEAAPSDVDGCRLCGECGGIGVIPLGRPKKVLIADTEDYYGYDPIRSYEEDCLHCRGTGYCPNHPPSP